MPDAPRRIHRFEDRAVEVGFDAAPTRVWLDETLSPWFDTVDGGDATAAGYRVELVRAEDPLAALGLGAARQPSGARPCFALDTRTLELPAWRTGAGAVLHDARYASYLEVGRTRTRVVSPPGALEPRIALMRAVREVAVACRWRRPGVLAVHAAGFSVAGRTVLVLGSKEAGKTTLLLHVLRTGEAELVANDRAFLACPDDGSPPQAIGVPTFVRVRPGTLAMFPELARGLPSTRPLFYTFAELEALRGGDAASRRADAARSPVDGHVVMTPAQLCRQAGAPARRGGALAAVLLVERAPEAAGAPWRLEPLGADDACAALLANRYGLAARAGPPTVFEEIFAAGGSCEPDEPRERELARRVASRVPVVRCRVGVTRRPEPERAAALLRSLSV